MSTDRDDGAAWRLLPHCCARCFGRVLQLVAPVDGRGRNLYRCSNCGHEARDHHVRSLCACGIHLKTGKDAGIRCIEQRQPSPECPAQVVAEQR